MFNSIFMLVLLFFCVIPILGELLAFRNFRRVLIVMIDNSDHLSRGEDFHETLTQTKQVYNMPPMYAYWSQQMINHLVHLPSGVFKWFKSGDYLQQLAEEQIKFYGKRSQAILMRYYHRSFWANAMLLMALLLIFLITGISYVTKFWLVTADANMIILGASLLVLLITIVIIRMLGFPFKLAYAALPMNWDYVKSAYSNSKNSVLATHIDLHLSTRVSDSELINKLLDGSDVITQYQLVDHVTNATLASKVVQFQRLISVFKVVLNTPLHLSQSQSRDIMEMYLLNTSVLESLTFLFSILDDAETLTLLTCSVSDLAEQSDRKMFVSFNQLVENLKDAFDQVNKQLKESLDKTLVVLDSTSTDKLTIDGDVRAMNQQQKLDYFNQLFKQRHSKGVNNDDTKED